MNIALGDTVSLRVGNNKLLQWRQFCVFVSGGGSPGTEISEDQLAGYFMVRQGTSWLITAATGGAHKIFAGFAEQAYAEVVQHFVLDHIMSEIITPHLFDKAIEHTVKKVLKAGVKKAMGPLIPSDWGVCSTFFMAALDGNERYVYRGPEIEDGTLVQGEKLWIGSYDNGFDPVVELAKITVHRVFDRSDLIDICTDLSDRSIRLRPDANQID
jgi:hypothetical protein